MFAWRVKLFIVDLIYLEWAASRKYELFDLTAQHGLNMANTAAARAS